MSSPISMPSLGSNGLPTIIPIDDHVIIYDEAGTSAITKLPEIASGNYSVVYKCADDRGAYAIKLCCWDDEEHGYLFRELYALILLKGHPNIPRLYAVGTHQNKGGLDVSYHMEYVENTLTDILLNLYFNLRSADDALRIRTQSNATVIAIDIVRGLKWMHDNGLLHCDIKPANILIHVDIDSGGNRRMTAKVCDFSIVTLRSEKYHSSAAYTVWQRPPEILYPDGDKLITFDTEADVYALGWTILSILTGNQRPAYDYFALDRHDALCKYYKIECCPRIAVAAVFLARLSVEEVSAVIAKSINLPQSIWVDAYMRIFAHCCVPNPMLRPTIDDIERDLINIHTNILEPSGVHPRVGDPGVVPMHSCFAEALDELNEYSEYYAAMRRRAIDNNIRCPKELLLCAVRIFRTICEKNNITLDDTLTSMIWIDAALFAACSLHSGSEISFDKSGIVVAPDHIADILRNHSWI